MPTTETSPAQQVSRAQRFAEYIRPAVVAAGYDIDSPRGGGKKALAKDTGMSPSSVGRMLAGQTVPEPAALEKLAGVLGLSLTELLVRTGVVSGKRRVAATDRPEPPKPVTVEEAARQWGIKDPGRIKLFKAMVAALRDEEGS